MTQPSRVGGRREGAGPKFRLSATGGVTKAYVLRPDQPDIIEQWRQEHGLLNASAALRQIIDKATKRRRS